jgi:streptogramin lyase
MGDDLPERDDRTCRSGGERGRAVDRRRSIGVRIVPAEDELWVAVVESERIDRIDPDSGEVVGRIALDGNPFDLQAGHGSIWSANRGSGRVWRLNPRTAEVEAKIEVESTQLYGLIVTRDAVWVADELGGTVIRIDPSTNRVVARVELGGTAYAFAPSPSGVWVTSGEGVLSRIDEHTDRVAERVHAGSQASDPATLDGLVWVPDADAGVVEVFDGRTGELVSTLRLGGTYLVAQAAFGDVWVADFRGTTIVRLDPSIVTQGG